MGSLGLPWWTNAAVAMIGAVIAVFMREERRRTFDNEKEVPIDEQSEEEDAMVNGPNASLETLQSTPASPLLARFDRGSSAY